MIQNPKNKKKMKNLLICFTGSVATIKDKLLVEKFLSTNLYNIKLLYSKTSMLFSTILKTKKNFKNIQIILDSEEWKWKKIGDKVLHIYLSNWSEIILIAPLSANSLAKIANGLSDNTITLVLRATKFVSKFDNKFLNWIYHGVFGVSRTIGKIVVVCPAMNTWMYEHPVMDLQIRVLKSWGVTVVEPVVKLLACNVRGKGAMECPCKILEVVRRLS